jgi:hypothetical protein
MAMNLHDLFPIWRLYYDTAGHALPESIERFIEDQAFLPTYDLAHSPPPPFPSASWLSFSVFLCAGRTYWRERGGGMGAEPNLTTARRPDPLWIIQYSLRPLPSRSRRSWSREDDCTMIFMCSICRLLDHDLFYCGWRHWCFLWWLPIRSAHKKAGHQVSYMKFRIVLTNLRQ